MVKREQNNARNGPESSGQETVKGGFGGPFRSTSMSVKTGRKDKHDKDTKHSSNNDNYGGIFLGGGSPDVSPTDQRSTQPFPSHHRKALAVLGASDQHPSISRNPPTAGTPNAQIAPWDSGPSPGTMPPGFNNFFDDISDQLSPSFRPGTSRTAASDSPDIGFDADERRPSVASANTISSQGSKSSASGGRFHKKLQGFFGEEVSESKHGSDSSLPQAQSQSRSRDRNNSVHTTGTGNGLEASDSRPRTPLPPSDVTPWDYQNFKDIPKFGDAPVRQAPMDTESPRQTPSHQTSPAPAPKDHHHRFHIPGSHRHTRSTGKDETPKKDLNPASYPQRPTTGRGDSSSSFRGGNLPSNFGTPMSSTSALGGRPKSPTPSYNSAATGEADQRSMGGKAGKPGKGGLFGRLKKQLTEPKEETLKTLPSSQKSLTDPHRNNKAPPPEFSAKDRAREASLASFESDSTAKQSDFAPTTLTRETTANTAKTSHFPKIGRRGTRGLSYEGDPGGKGTAQVRKESTIPEGLWNLDTDLSDMGGIVDKGTAVSPGDTSGIFTGLPEPDEKRKDSKDSGPFAGGNWDAPDSWGVKKQGDDVVGRLPEIDEDGDLAVDEDDGTPYFVRVFRADSTFATLSTSLSTTVSDIVQMLGKKSFLQHDLGKYQIVMKKNDLQRQLDPGERPIAMQKRLLEQVGYEASDHIEEIGREDNSYLVKFTFLPAKHALDKDLGFNKMQKFSHVDLQGRGLDTIPITLYQKSPEIISLNLSRNLALDVPKDFIQGCINLREIKYVSNEAWRLPPSFSLASRLTVLDISNNRLEQLDHAGLEKLTSLVSIKMSNNRLSSLPPYFGGFKQLRSLNMSSNNFSEFPDFIGDLKSLVDLDVSFNTLSNLPNVGKLKNLERIWATNNNLAGAFNQEFETLENLKEIDVRFNGITNIDSVSGLPKLEQLLVGHNAISTFTGCFQKLRTLLLDHCPMTTFDLTAPVLSLTTLNIASAKLSSLKDSLFENMPNLTKFILDKNHFVNLPTSIGKLRKLEHFSVAKNPLSNIPASIGCLTELRYLNLREANLGKLPAEIWYCLRLETLNLSSNVLENFPKPGTAPPPFQQEQANGTPATTPGLSSSPSYEELGKLEDFGARRPSQASGGLLSVGSSPAGSTRKGSIVSVYGLGGRKASVVSRTPTDGTMTPVTRKDSNLSQKIINTFAGSMRYLYLADNRLQDEVFREISMLPELRVLNMSYNELTDLPQGLLRRWPNITELYLSGNELTSLPSDDLEEISNLKVLQINGNKFQVLPAELCKVQKLAILDVGSNSLKYNVSNWPYDWNWNWNRNLKFLNFSGNKRLEIKPAASSGMGGANNADLTNFSSLTHLRVLGLMDVTLTIPSVPDQTEDRRVRTTASIAGSINYGMADTLGRNEHLSTIDLVVPSFRSNQIETLIGMFDGQALSSGGSKVAKYLHENFVFTFTEELAKVNKDLEETPSDALRRSFLSLNKDMATAANASQDTKEHRVPHLPHLSHRGSTSVQVLSAEDLNSGGVATVLYIHGTELYVANVGDAQSMLIRSDGGFKFLTRKHDPAEPRERQRIREAGGYVSRQGKLNDVLEISRAFGYFQMVPSVTAAPSTLNITLSEQDEMILIATKELWDFVTPDVVVDVARADRQDLMLASQKLRDLAMAFGATSKIMVMMIGVSDLRKQSRNRFRNQSVSIGGNLMGDDNMFAAKRGKRQAPGDSRLARLDEVEAPIGHVAIIFTDIKNSTNLWETFPVAMKTGISMHNELMRRQLRIIGGYEVKTEGDAFMVSFQTATAALLWCFTVQQQLLEQPWPSEILETLHCQERVDTDGNVIFRGLSVRMGIHWGQPVCEPDPVTKRMDYFGPMVNRAARVSGVADGGQIYVSSDFIAEIQRTLETYAETDRSGSTGSEETINDDLMGMSIRKDLRQLSNQGFEVKDLGERKLKGLENPETIYLMYPHSLAGRLAVQPDKPGEAENAPGVLGKDSQLSIDTDIVWKLWNLSLRLEMLCSSFENPNGSGLKAPETTLLDRMKNRGGEITDTFLVNFIEHQVCRVETCTTTLHARHLVKPFNRGSKIADHCGPIGDVFQSLYAKLAELDALKKHLEYVNDDDCD